MKSVTGDEGVCTYSADDSTSRARVPRWYGDLFDLHASDDDVFTLSDPEQGEIIVLTQHHQVTHLVEVTGESVEERPRSTVRKNSRDERFIYQREVKLLLLRKLDEAPLIDEVFGFDPRASGGEVLAIAELPAFISQGDPLWLVQRRIAHKMTAEERPGFRIPRASSRARRR